MISNNKQGYNNNINYNDNKNNNNNVNNKYYNKKTSIWLGCDIIVISLVIILCWKISIFSEPIIRWTSVCKVKLVFFGSVKQYRYLQL